MRVILLLALLALSGCQHLPNPPPVAGEIRDLNSGQILTAQELVVRLAGPSRLIVGEQHDNRDHHQLQLWLLQALGQRRPQGSLLLEMLTPIAKSWPSEWALEANSLAIQIHGGYGYTRDFPVE